MINQTISNTISSSKCIISIYDTISSIVSNEYLQATICIMYTVNFCFDFFKHIKILKPIFA